MLGDENKVVFLRACESPLFVLKRQGFAAVAWERGEGGCVQLWLRSRASMHVRAS